MHIFLTLGFFFSLAIFIPSFLVFFFKGSEEELLRVVGSMESMVTGESYTGLIFIFIVAFFTGLEIWAWRKKRKSVFLVPLYRQTKFWPLFGASLFTFLIFPLYYMTEHGNVVFPFHVPMFFKAFFLSLALISAVVFFPLINQGINATVVISKLIHGEEFSPFLLFVNSTTIFNEFGVFSKVLAPFLFLVSLVSGIMKISGTASELEANLD